MTFVDPIVAKCMETFNGERNLVALINLLPRLVVITQPPLPRPFHRWLTK